MEGSGVSNVLIEHNFIGVEPDGVSANGNAGLAGIGIFSGVSTVEIRDNVISGNDTGVLVASTCPLICLGGSGFPSGVLIQDNMIGTDSSGTSAVGNTNTGVAVMHSPDTTILNNVISGNGNQGISVGYWSASTFPIPSTVIIEGNKIGTDASGSAPLGNGGMGIKVGGGDNSQILNNTISDNGAQGIAVASFGFLPVSGLMILDNMIGTNTSGTAALGAQAVGVWLFEMTSGTQLINNVISGNTIAGVDIGHNTADNVLQNNLIGLDASGSIAIPNQRGISLSGSLSSNNLIGGSGAGQGNVISGNTNEGIQIFDSPGVLIHGNFIGTDATGNIAVPNRDGIRLGTASGVVVGGSGFGEGNLISGNTDTGIFMLNGTSNNQVLGNTLGLNITGTHLGIAWSYWYPINCICGGLGSKFCPRDNGFFLF